MNEQLRDFAIEAMARPEVVETIAKRAASAITTEMDNLIVIDALGVCKSLLKALETSRTELVGPLNKRVKQVNDAFRPHISRLETIEAGLKSRLLEWSQAERRRIAEEAARVERENAERRRKAEEETARMKAQEAERAHAEARDAGFSAAEAAELASLEAADVEPIAALLQVPPAPPATTQTATLGSAQIRKVWAFRIVDRALIPRQFLQVDEPAIRRAVVDGARSIPGVEIYETEQIAAGRVR